MCVGLHLWHAECGSGEGVTMKPQIVQEHQEDWSSSSQLGPGELTFSVFSKKANQQCGSDLHKSHWSFLIQINPTSNIYDTPFHSFSNTLGDREEGSQS